MVASRWNSSEYMPWLHQQDWPEEGEPLAADLRELMFKLAFKNQPSTSFKNDPVDETTLVETDGETGEEPEAVSLTRSDGDIPSALPILPLRGLVVYPETAVPLTIGQPRSIRLVDDVVQQ